MVARLQPTEWPTLRLGQELARLFEAGESTADLLSTFVATRDDRAFAELVRRFGPMVYGVCRRFLGCCADADDAFQTTFVVLAKKADAIRPPGKLSAWLHGVASLAAKKARQARARRRLREVTGDELPNVPARAEFLEPDFAPVLDEELERLPGKFRLPILLCGIRELTTAQAAAELGWPVGTVASRLSRGRNLLAERLVQRGIALSAALGLLSALSARATAAVPNELVRTAIASASLSGVTASVVSLTSEVLLSMKMTTLRLLGAGLILGGAVALFGGNPFGGASQAAPIPTAPSVEKKAAAAIERVKLGDLNGMIRQESIRKEIGLGDDDFKAITDYAKEKQTEADKAVQDEFQNQIRAIGGGGAPGGVIGITIDSEKIQAIQDEAQKATTKKILESLKPAGVRRLKQIALQMEGPSALLNRVVIRELQLTAEQEDKLDGLVKAPKSYVSNARVEKVAGELDEQMKSVLKVLTAEQKKQWEALIGKAIATADLVKASPNSEDSMNARNVGGAWTIGGGAIPIGPPPIAPPAAPAVPPPAN